MPFLVRFSTTSLKISDSSAGVRSLANSTDASADAASMSPRFLATASRIEPRRSVWPTHMCPMTSLTRQP